MNIDALSLAVTAFLGYGSANHPMEQPERLLDVFDSKQAHELEVEVRALLDELNKLQPDWSSLSLAEAGTWASNEMHRRHPELNQDALKALKWAFTWWWR